MARAFGRELDGYSERHHVVPRSLGGSNAKSNIVRLTYREHFLAHWLLTKFTTGREQIKMLHALHRMGNAESDDKELIVAGWQYAVARKAQRDAVLGCIRSQETRAKMSASNIAAPRGIAIDGRSPRSADECARISQRNRERVWSAESLAKARVSQLGKKDSPQTIATKSKAQTGRTHPSETKSKMSASATKLWADRRAHRGANLVNAVLSFGA